MNFYRRRKRISQFQTLPKRRSIRVNRLPSLPEADAQNFALSPRMAVPITGTCSKTPAVESQKS